MRTASPFFGFLVSFRWGLLSLVSFLLSRLL